MVWGCDLCGKQKHTTVCGHKSYDGKRIIKLRVCDNCINKNEDTLIILEGLFE